MMFQLLQALLLVSISKGFVPPGGTQVSQAPVHRFSPWTTASSSTSRPARPHRVVMLRMAPTNATAAPPKPTKTENNDNKKDNGATSRFDRTANRDMQSTEECILQIDGQQYNLTGWAKAHPGGVKVLHKFHNKDASKAFHAAAHSPAAYGMLPDFLVTTEDIPVVAPAAVATAAVATATTTTTTTTTNSKCPVSAIAVVKPPELTRPRWMQKFFTKEDPIGVHKYFGAFCLLNFVYRFGHMYFGDPTAGFGSATRTPWAVLSLAPHAILSLSSLIFHTVPRERVVGKPMIWQEYRIHNISFGLRSVVCGFLAWMAYRFPTTRTAAIVGSCATAFAAMHVADLGTKYYQPSAVESTTATMPYWEGCSIQTQKRFKLFYAYSQFMATLACIAVCNPAWPLAVLLAIQLASLLMTLVRKGIISARSYHICYAITLAMGYVVGFRNGFTMGHFAFPAMLATGAALFSLRRLGVSKYALWIPIFCARILIGDKFIPHSMW